MKIISTILSWVFSPLLVPTYGVMLALWTSYLYLAGPSTQWSITGISAAITCGVPLVAIMALYMLGAIKNPALNDRSERPLPYVVCVLAYAACAWFLQRVHAPQWLWVFMWGGCGATVLATIINTMWKISAHMTAMGGLVAVALRIWQLGLARPGLDYLTIISGVIIAAGAVGTARIYLQRHTPAQVYAGFALGLACVWCAMLINH